MHVWFLVKPVLDAWRSGGEVVSACAQCRYISFPQISVKFPRRSHDDYDPLLDTEGEPAVVAAAVDADEEA